MQAGGQLWSQDSPRSLKETAEGSRAGTPRVQSLPHSVEAETHPVTPKVKQAREVQ